MKALLLIYILMNSAFAVNNKIIQISGTHCDHNSVKIHFEKDKVRINLKKFDLFSKRKINRGTCLISLPLEVEQNQKYVISNFTLRGLSFLEKSLKGTVNSEIFFSTQSKSIKSSKKLGPKSHKFKIHRNKKLASSCGNHTLLRLNLSTVLKNLKDVGPNGLISLSKFNNDLTFDLKKKKCNE